jgi:uncharacterized membrane protein YdjX (TVP38/TMEM64 family)
LKKRYTVLPALALLTLVATAWHYATPERLQATRDWIAGLGPWGLPVFVSLYAVGTVAGLPCSPFSMASGLLFGPLGGIAAASAGCTAGACGSFLVSRYLLREPCERWLSRRSMFVQLDRATEAHAASMVAFTRLAPVFPFPLLNYGYGLTRVPFATYAFWSWLCMLPGVLFYVLGTHVVVKSFVDPQSISWPMVAGVVAAGAAMAVLVRQVRRMLRRAGLGESAA